MALPSSPAGTRQWQQAALLIAQGATLQQGGNLKGAVLAYQHAVNLAPDNPAGYRALLELLLDAGDLANAGTVVNAIPADVHARFPLLRQLQARLLTRRGDAPAALELLSRLQGGSDVPAAMLAFDRAECLMALGRHREALEALAQAEALGLRGTPLAFMRARASLLAGDFANAERCYKDLCRTSPERSDFKYDLAVLLLRTGQLEAGFRLYHHRWTSGLPQFQRHAAVEIGLPEWNGRKPVESLVVIQEQGLGEQILFSALLPALAQRVPRLAASLDPRLAPLIARSWPGIELLSPQESLASVRHRFDACLSAGDMPGVLSPATPWRHGYLQPDAAKVARLRDSYRRQFPGKTLVGISWKSTKDSIGAPKSIGLGEWQPLLARDGCQFINLQYGNVDAELAEVRGQLGVDIHRDPEIDTFGDMDGLLAQLAALDLVITTSNSTAHLAAAGGLPAWVLLPPPRASFWYWGHEGGRCAWYPDVTLFRAPEDGAWGPVIAAVARALDARFGPVP